MTLVHAYGPDFLAYRELAHAYAGFEDKAHDYEESRLRAFALEAFPARHVETVARLGEPGAVVLEIVRHQSTDLVMLPTHGRGPFRRFLLGSVAIKVLHDISAAVWTATDAAIERHAADIRYKSILCAVDESNEAEGVIRAAAALAAAYDAELHIVHAIEMLAPTGDLDLAPYKKILADDACVRLRELIAQLGVDAPRAVVDGPVAQGVRDEAIRTKADLIVTGRGRSQDTFARMMSRLYPVIREAPCPVLSI